MSDDTLLPFDPWCPWCHGNSGPGERHDGEDYRCDNCGRWVVATLFADGRYRAVKPWRCGDLTRREVIRATARGRRQRRGWA